MVGDPLVNEADEAQCNRDSVSRLNITQRHRSGRFLARGFASQYLQAVTTGRQKKLIVIALIDKRRISHPCKYWHTSVCNGPYSAGIFAFTPIAAKRFDSAGTLRL